MTLVIGHRGAPMAAPENTMQSFQAAAELGVDAVELDVHLTADGELVVIHDPTLDRTTDRSGAVAELSLTEVRSADAGFRHTTDAGNTFPFRGRGMRVPTLGEVLDWLPPALGVVVEVKPVAAAEPAADLLRRRRMDERASVISFEPEAIERARARAPEIPTGLLREPGDDFAGGLEIAVAGGHLALNVYEADLGDRPEPFVARAAAVGRRLGCYVVDDPDRMRLLAEAGLAAFVTNRPELARATLSEG